MADTIYSPRELGAVFDCALDHCFAAISKDEPGTVAYLVALTNDNELSARKITVIQTENHFEPLGNFPELSSGHIKIYAVAVAGQIALKPRNIDAVMIEAAEQGNDEAMLLACPYSLKKIPFKRLKHDRKLTLIGMRKSRLTYAEKTEQETE